MGEKKASDRATKKEEEEEEEFQICSVLEGGGGGGFGLPIEAAIFLIEPASYCTKFSLVHQI